MAIRASSLTKIKDAFEVGDMVLVANGTVFTTAKWPAFKPNFYVSIMVVSAKHPRHELLLSAGKRSRSMVNDQLCVRYYC